MVKSKLTVASDYLYLSSIFCHEYELYLIKLVCFLTRRHHRAGCTVSAHPAFWTTPPMATGVGVKWPFTQATFWLSLGFNNKNPFDSIEKTCGEGQRKISGAVLDILYLKKFSCMVCSVVEEHGKEKELPLLFFRFAMHREQIDNFSV